MEISPSFAYKQIKTPQPLHHALVFAALGALQILKEKNIKVPEEIALVGFGNEPFTSMLSPSITSVNQHSSEIGKQAALTFLERVKHPEIKQTLKKYILNAELIVRDSSNIKKTDKRKALKMLSRLSTFLFRVF